MSDEYRIVSELCCCGKTMVTVMMHSRAVCVMPKQEFSRIVETERFEHRNKSIRFA